ncbi:MAG: nitroreductase family protein [Candidatus Marinimicrobia bacterium]|nr:nitroreductase family protein [Candidatus Neomarinimicrobiota bacterium]
MTSKFSYINLIRRRSSRRSYRSESFSPETLKQIEKIISNTPGGLFNSPSTFSLVHKYITADQKIKLGTYGFISGAQYFVVGKTISGTEAFVDFGYCMEWIILQLTGLEFGTCWLGGTFTRSEFTKLLDLKEDEIIPAITPVGFATEKRSIRDRLIRFGAGSNHRKPWSEMFFNDDFDHPLTEVKAGDYVTVLEMVRLAPSASNKQPWRVVQSDNACHFYLQRTAGYSRMFPAIDLQLVDIGIAMCHFELSARELQLNGKWRSFVPGLILPESTEYILSWVFE